MVSVSHTTDELSAADAVRLDDLSSSDEDDAEDRLWIKGGFSYRHSDPTPASSFGVSVPLTWTSLHDEDINDLMHDREFFKRNAEKRLADLISWTMPKKFSPNMKFFKTATLSSVADAKAKLALLFADPKFGRGEHDGSTITINGVRKTLKLSMTIVNAIRDVIFDRHQEFLDSLRKRTYHSGRNKMQYEDYISECDWKDEDDDDDDVLPDSHAQKRKRALQRAREKSDTLLDNCRINGNFDMTRLDVLVRETRWIIVTKGFNLVASRRSAITQSDADAKTFLLILDRNFGLDSRPQIPTVAKTFFGIAKFFTSLERQILYCIRRQQSFFDFFDKDDDVFYEIHSIFQKHQKFRENIVSGGTI